MRTINWNGPGDTLEGFSAHAREKKGVAGWWPRRGEGGRQKKLPKNRQKLIEEEGVQIKKKKEDISHGVGKS